MGVFELRQEIERLRKAATRKVSRVKRTYGALVSGSEFDPRRAPQIHKRYTARQLETYKRELQGFLSRGNQYVSGSRGVPIPREKWSRYKAAEQQYNARVNANFERFAKVELPSGEPIESRMVRMTPRHRQMYNPAVNSPYDPPVRRSQSIVSERGLDKLIAEMEARLSGDYDKKRLDDGREQFKQMADRIGDDSLKDKVDSLNDEQWELLWNYTPFATDMSMDYQITKLMYEEKDQAWHHGVLQGVRHEYNQLLDWAKSV